MAVIVAVVTGLSLLLIRHQLRNQVTGELSLGICTHSVVAFENLQAERMATLERENALLAELPTLKALMTSGDDLTIQRRGGGILAPERHGLVCARRPNWSHGGGIHSKTAPPAKLCDGESKFCSTSPDKRYLIDGNSLYACAWQPLYFGSDQEGTLLGYVVSGVPIERTVREISQPTGVEATFFSDGQILASTLDPAAQPSTGTANPWHSKEPRAHQ